MGEVTWRLRYAEGNQGTKLGLEEECDARIVHGA